MKTKVKILSFLLAVLLFALSVPVTPVGAVTSSTDDTETYTKPKVVSVLFDNSGSMTGDKWHNARYALETMIAALGERDTLIITPMNVGNNPNDGTVTIVVEPGSNRTEKIKEIFNTDTQSFLAKEFPSNGRTPASSIDAARQQLVKKEYGMKTTADVKVGEVIPNDYFLVVLTDGVFDNPVTGTTNTLLDTPAELVPYFKGAEIPTYASFQTLYIAFAENEEEVIKDGAVVDMSKSSIEKDPDFTSYLAIGADGIGVVMKEVANRITGKCAWEIDVDKNSKTIHIPLDGAPSSLRTVTVLTTNTDARYKSVTYGSKIPEVAQNVEFGLPYGMPDTAMKGGFCTVFSLGEDESFSGGELVVTLDQAPGDGAVISVLLEPALILEPVITHDGVEMSAIEINNSLYTNDKVCVSYRLARQEEPSTAILPTEIDTEFDFATDLSITHNAEAVNDKQEVTLAKGENVFNISLSFFDGTYTLYTSLTCKVLDSDGDFKLVFGPVDEKSETLFELPATVYYEGKLVTDLTGYEYGFSAFKEDGSKYPLPVRENGGVITLTLDVSSIKGQYGTFKITGAVYSPDGHYCDGQTTIGYYPEGMQFITVAPDNDEHIIEKTLYGITKNDKDAFAFAFGATDETGTFLPISFDVSNLSYTLKVGGVDVTDSDAVRTEGNLLYFTPNAEALGELAEKVGDYAVVLEGSFTRGNKPAETMRAEAKLVLTPTAFKLIPTQATGSVDRFRLKGNQSSVYFLVERDGVLLSKEELESVPLNEVFRIHHGSYRTFLSPVRTKATVEEYGDDGAIRVRVCAGHFEPLRGLVTSMLVFGSKLDISATYEDASAVGTIPLKAPNIFSYIWRILLILYIIQLIILALTFKKVKRIPQGVYVRVPLLDPGVDGCDLKGKVIVIKALGWKDYLIFKRLLPFVGLCFWKKNITTSEGVLKYHQNAGVCVDGGLKCLEGEMKPGGSIVSGTLKSKGWSALKPGASFALNKVMLPTVKVIVTPKAAKANIDQPLSGVRGLVVKNKFYLFVSARSVGKKK